MDNKFDKLLNEYRFWDSQSGLEDATDKTFELRDSSYITLVNYVEGIEVKNAQLQQAIGLLSTLDIISDLTINLENPENMIRILFERLRVLQAENAHLKEKEIVYSNNMK